MRFLVVILRNGILAFSLGCEGVVFGGRRFERVTLCGGWLTVIGGWVTLRGGLLRVLGGLVTVGVGLEFFGEMFLPGRGRGRMGTVQTMATR
jgi:hypothetical protein